MKKKKKHFQIYDIINFGEEEAIVVIHKKNAKFFNLGVKILKLAYDIFPFGSGKTKLGLDQRVQRILLALYTQLFRLYRSVLALCKSGLDTESHIMLRSMLDAISYLLYLAEKDHTGRLLWYMHSRALSQWRAVNDYVSVFPKSKSMLNMKWFEEKYNDALKYFKDKHGHDKTEQEIKKNYALRPDFCANNVEKKYFKNYHTTFHRYASSITHAENIFAYIKPTIQSNRFLLPAIPTSKDIPFAVTTAIVFMIIGLDRINDLILKNGFDSRIQQLDKELGIILKEEFVEPALRNGLMASDP